MQMVYKFHFFIFSRHPLKDSSKLASYQGGQHNLNSYQHEEKPQIYDQQMKMNYPSWNIGHNESTKTPKGNKQMWKRKINQQANKNRRN